MYDIYSLRQNFPDDVIWELERIFCEAQDAQTEADKERLKLQLLHLLRGEMAAGVRKLATSPDGNHHIVATDNMCMLVNLWGVEVLFNSWLFAEGELALRNFQWIERDNLVVFEKYYIVHDEYQKCICHFARDSFFVYETPITKDDNRACEILRNALLELSPDDEW